MIEFVETSCQLADYRAGVVKNQEECFDFFIP
jgi:hypothetical protein